MARCSRGLGRLSVSEIDLSQSPEVGLSPASEEAGLKRFFRK